MNKNGECKKCTRLENKVKKLEEYQIKLLQKYARESITPEDIWDGLREIPGVTKYHTRREK